MEIRKKIELNIINKGQNIICHSLSDLIMVLGTASVSGNYHLYGVKKDKNNFIVPIQVIKERIKFIEGRIAKDVARIDLMKQIIK